MKPGDKAVALFRAFYNFAPEPGDVVELDAEPAVVVLRVGALCGVLYEALDNETPYLHRFNKTRRPDLFVSADGSQIYILSGGYKFTDRGFIG